MEAAVDRYIKASNKTTAGAKSDAGELTELKAVQSKLDVYLKSSDQTIEIMTHMWQTSIPTERGRLREEAERYAAIVAGPKLMDVTLSLEELLTAVGRIAGDIRNDGDSQLRRMTVITMAVSLVLAGLVLLPLRRR